MTADLILSPSDAITHVNGNTDDGDEFVDAWVLGTLEVVDSGHIVVTNEVVAEMEAAAVSNGLVVEHD
jgi:hypothetical protein